MMILQILSHKSCLYDKRLLSYDIFRKFYPLKPGLESHCRRALAPAPAPELSSTHSLAPAPAPELSSTYPLAPAPAPALQLFNKQEVYHLVFKSFLR